jgi:hypothetical protein
VKNTTPDVLVFRDEAGKHRIPPGADFDLSGAQHEPMVRALIEAGARTADEPTPVAVSTTTRRGR